MTGLSCVQSCCKLHLYVTQVSPLPGMRLTHLIVMAFMHITEMAHVGLAGVNPMITTESIAYMTGQGMAAKYKYLAGKRRAPVDIKYEDGKE